MQPTGATQPTGHGLHGDALGPQELLRPEDAGVPAPRAVEQRLADPAREPGSRPSPADRECPARGDAGLPTSSPELVGAARARPHVPDRGAPGLALAARLRSLQRASPGTR